MNIKTINLNNKAKHRLSVNCRDNFLQFLMIQKAGKEGDIQLLQHLQINYPKQLEAKIIKSNNNIAYLQSKEQSEKILQRQAKMILSNHRSHLSDRPQSRLDQIITKPKKCSPECLLTTIDKFNI